MLATIGCATPVGTKSGDDSGVTGSSSSFGGIAAQPDAVNFGAITLNMSATATISLTNTSGGEVTLSNAFTDGDGFELDNSPSMPQSLSPDDSVTVAVRFDPNTIGDYEGTLNIGVAGEVGYGEVALRGSVRSDGDEDPDEGDGILTANPTTLSFGEAGLTDVVWRNVELSNTGTAPLLIKSVTSSSPSIFQTAPDFSMPKVLGPTSAVSLLVGFSPTEMRDYAAIIDIETDTVSGGTLLPVSGTGSDSGCSVCAPIMNVSTTSGGNEFLRLSPLSGVGCTANGGVTVSNSGDQDLDITAVSLVNDLISTCGTFVLSWSGPSSVEPGTSTTIGVDYIATESCFDSPYELYGHNVLTIEGTDPVTPTHQVALEGDALFCG